MRRLPPILALLPLALAPAPASADAGFHHVLPSLGLAKPCEEGASCLFTWTLATRLGHVLAFTEERYGARDRRWTLLGVEFARRETPQVWYPSYGAGFNSVVIQLTADASRDEMQALYQLAHDVVHTLSPAGPNRETSVLEEGLATYNSLDYLQAQGFAITPDYIDAPRYEAAYRLVVELARQRPDLNTAIQALRQMRGSLSQISASDLQLVFPGISSDLADRLAARF